MLLKNVKIYIEMGCVTLEARRTEARGMNSPSDPVPKYVFSDK